MPHHHQNAAVPARIQHIHPLYLLLVDDRHPEIGKDKQQSSPELRRCYAQDSKRMLVQLNRTAHHAAIILKMAMPKHVGEHDIRSAVWTLLIGAMEETAKIRVNA